MGQSYRDFGRRRLTVRRQYAEASFHTCIFFDSLTGPPRGWARVRVCIMREREGWRKAVCFFLR